MCLTSQKGNGSHKYIKTTNYNYPFHNYTWTPTSTHSVDNYIQFSSWKRPSVNYLVHVVYITNKGPTWHTSRWMVVPKNDIPFSYSCTLTHYPYCTQLLLLLRGWPIVSFQFRKTKNKSTRKLPQLNASPAIHSSNTLGGCVLLHYSTERETIISHQLLLVWAAANRTEWPIFAEIYHDLYLT